MPGFGNDFETEALPGALPVGQNSPQRTAYGLYAEQLSGSPFTAPRGTNERSWLYRIRPSVQHAQKFKKTALPIWKTAPSLGEHDRPIGQLRWGPVPIPKDKLTFLDRHAHHDDGRRRQHAGRHGGARLSRHPVDGRTTTSTTPTAKCWSCRSRARCASSPSSAASRRGRARSASSRAASSSRSSWWTARRAATCARTTAPSSPCPTAGRSAPTASPTPRDFKTPVAAFEDKEEACRLTVKWCGGFHVAEIGHSPLDVVAWHGNYAPYKYDLRHFSPVGAILFDHPDPSIFTVLTAPSETAGTANIDFVIFPERWSVAEHSFRPPWYHMNIMSEFMGLIYGVYDAKPEGFTPGGMSLHNCMLPHGPDKAAYDHATKGELKPVKLTNTMAFMFETRFPQHLTKFAAELETLQEDYADCWTPLEKNFTGAK